MALIQCEHVALGYGKQVLVQGLDLEVTRGDYLCIVGDNGVGKSTFLRTLLGLQPLLAGQITLGEGLTQKDLGYLPQQTQVQRDFPATVEEIVSALGEEARAIRREDEEMCQKIAEHGLSLLKPGDGVLTHCNAGPLATSKYGTALGPILLGHERGIPLNVFADETRPLLQGARLTAWELQQAGVDVTLICDNMASMVMKNGSIQACFVGCDRVAANGDTANKIGTSGVAILARHYGVPFYVLGPTSTIDWTCPDGDHIPIEERDGEEIRSLWYREPMAPAGVKCYNPAFDVTDHTLISGIVTEYGICRPPFSQSLKKLFETISSK